MYPPGKYMTLEVKVKVTATVASTVVEAGEMAVTVMFPVVLNYNVTPV